MALDYLYNIRIDWWSSHRYPGIWLDSEERDEDNRGAGPAQKVFQSSEGVLEALPEVIMQSVFYMRAANHEHLVCVYKIYSVLMYIM